MGSDVVKKTVKTSLKGKWLDAVICSSLLFFSYLFVQYCASVLSLIFGEIAFNLVFWGFFIFALLPLFLGGMRYFWRLLFGADDKVTVCFYYFSSFEKYKKAMRLFFSVILRIALWGIIFYLPSIIARFFSGTFFYNLFDISAPIWVSGLWPITALLKILGTLALVVVILKLYISPVLFIADDDMDCAEAIHMSTIISKGSAMEFVYLIFSLIGWLFLCLFMVPVIFILPYIICCYLIHVRFSIAKYNKHISNSGDDTPTFAV